MEVFEDILDKMTYTEIVNMIYKYVEEHMIAANRVKHIRKFNKFYIDFLNKTINSKKRYFKIYYIKLNDEIVGFEMAQIYYEKKREVMIGQKAGIYIKKEYRGHIVNGKFIVYILNDAVEEWFKNEKIAIQKISTLETNKKHVSVYKRMGYKEIGRVNGSVYFEKVNL